MNSIDTTEIQDKKHNKSITKFLTDKLKNINILCFKNPKIIILAIIFIVVLVAYFTLFSNKTYVKVSKQSQNYTNSLDYANYLENKIVKVVSSLSGAGKVSAMVTLSSSLELVYAESVDEKTNTTVSGSSTTSSNNTSSETIIVSNNGENSPLIVKEILPNIRGVVVVCDGAKDVGLKLKIVQAIKALLEIPSENIQVLY